MGKLIGVVKKENESKKSGKVIGYAIPDKDYLNELAAEQTFENIDLNSPEIFAKQQQYKQNNPNLYALMGGRAYNPIPSVNPTQLTKEDLEKVQTAQAWDKARRELIEKKNAAAKTNSETQKKNELSGAVGWLQSFANDYMQGEKKQSTASPTYSAEDIEYIVSAAMSDDEQKALQAAKNRYKDTAYFAKMMGAKAPENKQDNSAKDVIGRINASQKRMNNLEGDYSSDEVKAINKYARLYAQYTGLVEPEDAFSTLARLTGDFENNENYRAARGQSTSKIEDGERYFDLTDTTESRAQKVSRVFEKGLKTPYDDDGLMIKMRNADIEYLTEDEREQYYRKMNVSPQQGDAFYREAIPTIEARKIQSAVDWAKNLGSEHSIAGSALSVLFSIGAAPEQLANAIRYIETGTMGYNSMTAMSSGIRSAVSEKVDLQIGKWDAFDFVYNTVMSGVDSAVNAAAFGPMGSVMLGLSAAGSSSNDILQCGGTAKQAFWGGLAAGALEGLFEKATIGNLKALKEINAATAKDVFKNMAKSMLVNGTEETFTEIANIAYDTLFNGDISQLNMLTEQYMSEGLSEEEAVKKACIDLLGQVAEAGASGVLMGFGFSGIAGARSLINTNRNSYNQIGKKVETNNLKGTLFNIASGLEEDSPSRLYAESISESAEASTAQLGQLAVMVTSELRQTASREVASAVYDRLIAAGQTVTDADINSKAIAAVISNTAISQEQKAKLLETAQPGKVYSELMSGDTAEWVQSLEADIKPYSDKLVKLQAVFDNINTESVIDNGENSELQSTANGGIINQNESEGAENVGEQVYNGSQRIRRESGNPESSLGGVQEANGRVSGIAQESNGRRETFTNLSNQRNNRRITPEQNESLKTTAIKNKDGTPKEVYHFTDNMEFEVFAEGDIGFHFGSEDQARKHRENLKNKGKVKTDGRFIKAYLDIKNPVNISSDIMVWHASQTALRLWTDGIITEEQYKVIHQMQVENGGTYNTPAAAELRRILSEKGYDGIVYQNNDFFEGKGESYIALYPEQVIIIDDGKSKATSAEAASSFAQNESSGDKGETELTKLNTENTKRRHTNRAEQEYLTGVGKDLSVSVVHEDIEKVLTAQGYKLDGNIPDGYIDEKGVIHIGFNVVNPTKFILKHELVHYGRGTEGYKNYTDAIDKTKAFKEWLQKKTGAKTDSIGELKGLYRDMIKRTRGKLAPKSTTKLNEEMYADFSGEVVFTTSSFEQLIKQVNSKDRPAIIQFVIDFLSFLKDKLSGKKGITFEIKRLESKYSAMLREATKTTHTAEGEGLRFSVSKSFEEQIDDVINGEHNPRWDIYVSETPKVFTDLGFSKSPLLMRNSKVKEILNKHSEMTVEKIKLIPKAIQEPILVLKSKTHPTESVVAITDIQTDKGEMIIPVWINQEGNYLDLEIGEEIVENTNFVATAYGRNIKSLLEYAHENNGFLYQSSDIEKVRQLLARNGLQLPTPLKLSDSDITISQEDSIVNTNSTQKDEKYTESGEKDFSIPTIEDEAIDTDKDVSDRDIVSETERLSDEYNSGRISREEYRERLQELLDEAHETYGAHPRGENAKADIPVPRKVAKNKPVERFVRTVIEADVLTEDMLEDIETDILLGNFSYEMISDEKAQNYAKEKMAAQTAERDWIAAFEKGTVSKNDLAVGEMLLKDAIERDDRLRVLELSAELSDMFTRAGQMVQAARMFKKMTGAGRVVTVQRNIKTLNKSLEEKYGDKFGKNKKIKPIQLDPTLATQLTEAQTQEDVETVMKDVTESIANQVPATWLDKLNAWRYFAMLANPRTHIRNIIGNLVFTPVIVIKNTVAAGTERVAQLIVKDENGRTKSVVIKKEYRDFAARDVKKQEAQLMLQGTGQLDAKGQIAQMQRTFETEWLEKITKGNSNLLESEDMLFKSIHYKIALAGYLQAQGVDLKSIDSKTLDKAREYAVKEAKKATFQDASFIAEMLNKSFRIPKGSKWEGNRGAETASLIARFAVEGILPFKRTPINIIKRGIEYSPAGLAKACTLGIYDVVKGKITVSEFCDGLAAGLTGTGIMLIGMWLNSLGLINGGFGDDEEDKFKQLNGEQEYSVKILGKSYSIDWAAPACLALFIGTELMQELSRDGLQIRDIGDVVWNTLEPITNLSMLSGIQGLIDAVKYEDGSKTIATMAGDMATSFAMQFVPSAFGALARTVDPTQRTWYTDKNSQFDEFLQGAGNNLASKIPGLSYIQAASIDAWGRERSRGGTVERIAENFVSPGYFTEIDYDNTAKELERLYKSTGENVFPKVATKSFEVDGKTKHLTANEWEKYAKTKGQQSYAYIHEFTESKAYEGLTDGERAKVITNLYKLANAKAKAEVSDYDLDKQFKSVTRYEKNGGSAVTYYIYRALSD